MKTKVFKFRKFVALYIANIKLMFTSHPPLRGPPSLPKGRLSVVNDNLCYKKASLMEGKLSPSGFPETSLSSLGVLALAVDEVFETNAKYSSSVSLRLPPSPTGEGL